MREGVNRIPPFHHFTTTSLEYLLAKYTKYLIINIFLIPKVIKNKKETYLRNKAKGIIPLTIEELTKNNTSDGDGSGLANDAKTLADTVFKGYRDDLDFNDENDVGK